MHGLTTGVLLGAGASVDAEIPDTVGLTKRVVEYVAEFGRYRHHYPTVSPALNYVVATLNARETLRGHTPFETIDIERVFSAVESLANREELDLSAFVGSWSSDISGVDMSNAALSRIASDLRKEILQLQFQSDSRSADRLRDFVTTTIGGSGHETFTRALDAMIEALQAILTVKSDDAVAYLHPLAEIAKSQTGGLMVATLNYDLTVETMCLAEGVSYSTGMDTWPNAGRWDFPQSGVSLLKLHGSINWRLSNGATAPGSLPHQQIIETDPKAFIAGPDVVTRDVPAIVFGQTKLRPDGPFVALLLEFARRLEGIEHLVIVGYSFRDDHVNEQLRRWINADTRREITVVDPGMPTTHQWGWPRVEDSFRSQLLWNLLPDEPTRTPSGETIPVPPNREFPPRLHVVPATAKDGLRIALDTGG